MALPILTALPIATVPRTAMVAPILPAIVGPLGGTAFTIGLLFAAYNLVHFLAIPTFGALEDRHGRRVVQLASMGGVIAGTAIFAVGVWSGAGLWVLFVG